MAKSRTAPRARARTDVTDDGASRRGPARKAARGHPAKTAPAPSPRPSARARRIAPEVRRQAILEAALAVFAAHGFEAARLDDVAARAGVAKGTVYLYFKRQGGAVRGAGPRRRVAHARADERGCSRSRMSSPSRRWRCSSRCSRRRCSAPSASCCCASSSPKGRAFRPSPSSTIARSSRAAWHHALAGDTRRSRAAVGQRCTGPLPAADRGAAADGGDLGWHVRRHRSARRPLAFCVRTASSDGRQAKGCAMKTARARVLGVAAVAAAGLVALAAMPTLRKAGRAAAVPGLGRGLLDFRQSRRGRSHRNARRCAKAMSWRSGRRSSRSMPICSGRRWPRTRRPSSTRGTPTSARRSCSRRMSARKRRSTTPKRRLRTAEARLNSAKTRLERRRVASSGRRQRPGGVFPRRRAGAGRPADRLDCCRPRTFACASSCRRRCCPGCTSAIASPSAATVAPSGLTARVNFISAQAEFTPPVIYSQEERARLVFRVEAMPGAAPGTCASASRSRWRCRARRV